MNKLKPKINKFPTMVCIINNHNFHGYPNNTIITITSFVKEEILLNASCNVYKCSNNFFIQDRDFILINNKICYKLKDAMVKIYE
jgi:hypothetical protein